MIKLSILITFVILVISLFSSLFFVYKDEGAGNRGLYSLSLRAGLAMLLLAQIGYGLATGQIGSRAPWDKFDAPNAPPVKAFQSKAPEANDPVKDRALEEARKSYLEGQEALKSSDK